MRMRHPKSDQVIEVHPGQVAMYETQGWRVEATRVPTKKTSARKTTKAPAATDKE